MSVLLRQAFEDNNLDPTSLDCAVLPGGICVSTENCTVLEPIFSDYQFNVSFAAQPEYTIQIPLSAVMRDASKDLNNTRLCEFLVINLGPANNDYSAIYIFGSVFFTLFFA